MTSLVRKIYDTIIDNIDAFVSSRLVKIPILNNLIIYQETLKDLKLNGLFENDYIYTLITKNQYVNFINYELEMDLGKPSIGKWNRSDFNNFYNSFFSLLRLKLENFHHNIGERINYLNTKPNYPQKSLLWHQERQKMITASEAFKITSNNKISDETVRSKHELICNVRQINSPAILHGVNYEDVSLKIYESRHKLGVREYSIIQSDTNSYIGASPDGIIDKVDYLDYDSFSRYGRMVEIKNPYTRFINGNISDSYAFQMQQQMFVAKLPICDFLETDIKDITCKLPDNGEYKYGTQYGSLNDMLEDVLDETMPNWEQKIQNSNIPIHNLSSMGMEKGVIIVFVKDIDYNNDSNNDDSNNNEALDRIIKIYPLHIKYDKTDIIKWMREQKKIYMSKGFLNSEVLYWKLYKLNVQSVLYDRETYENVKIPLLENAWNYIQNSYQHRSKNNESASASTPVSASAQVMQDINLSLL